MARNTSPSPLITNKTIFTRNEEVNEGNYNCHIQCSYLQDDQNDISKRIPEDIYHCILNNMNILMKNCFGEERESLTPSNLTKE